MSQILLGAVVFFGSAYLARVALRRSDRRVQQQAAQDRHAETLSRAYTVLRAK